MSYARFTLLSFALFVAPPALAQQAESPIISVPHPRADRPALKFCEQPPCYYPTIGLLLHWEATCHAKVDVDANGVSSNLHVTCDKETFLAAAKSCASRQRIRPALKRGKPAPFVGYAFELDFRLPDLQAEPSPKTGKGTPRAVDACAIS